jgi:NAD(P)-dependent dehydrogenase (short-subunit alcohol dehydrogenase family)
MTAQKTALVTGVSRGLGRSTALHLARSGAAVLGTYNRHAEEAQDLVAEAAAEGFRVVVLPLDVTRSETYPAFVDAVRGALRDSFGADGLDALVNNAGIGIFAPYEQTTPEQFDELMHVNVKAPFFLTQALVPLMATGGRVLNVTTALTRGVVPGMSAYAASKGAVEVLTRYQASELAARGIRVNTLMGGAAETDFGGGIMRAEQVKELAAHTIALGRIATVDDIAAAVPSILSEGFAWATGGCIDVSGGQSI